MNKPIYTYDDIRRLLPADHQVVGDKHQIRFSVAKPILEANEESVAWVSPERQDQSQLIARTKARTIFLAAEHTLDLSQFRDKVFVLTANPKLSFQRLVGALFFRRDVNVVSHLALVHPEAKLGKRVGVAPFTYVGRAEIGDDTLVYGNCYIHDGVRIGSRVVIHAGAVIGADGFGLTRNERNEFENFPHVGGVIIEDDVEIGANTCIDRGTLGNTHIKIGAKIDNLVHVAHNVEIGRHSAVVANTMIGGSTRIGDYTWVAPSATLRDRIEIGSGTTVGLGAVVTKAIPDNEVWTGNPAMELSKLKALQDKISKL